MARQITVLFSLCLLAACQSSRYPNTEQKAPQPQSAETQPIASKHLETLQENQWQHGQLQYIELEGGFYGIVLPTGKKLLPLNLAEQYAQAGAFIRFKAKASNINTLQQWGTPVTLLAIEILNSAQPANPNH